MNKPKRPRIKAVRVAGAKKDMLPDKKKVRAQFRRSLDADFKDQFIPQNLV